jgi:hypothetical protein
MGVVIGEERICLRAAFSKGGPVPRSLRGQ